MGLKGPVAIFINGVYENKSQFGSVFEM